MLLVVSEEKDAFRNRENWDMLLVGQIFDDCRHTYIVAKRDSGMLEVIELHPDNIASIITGQPCATSIYAFGEIDVANIHEQWGPRFPQTASIVLRVAPARADGVG